MQSISASNTGRKDPSRDKYDPPEADEAELIYDTEEMRAKLRCGKTMLHALMKSGQLKYRKLGNKTVFLSSDFRAFIATLPLGTPSR